MPGDRFIHRTLKQAPSPYETALSGVLAGILARSIHELDAIVAALNQSPIRPEGMAEWTPDVFVSEMERLGSYPNSHGGRHGTHIPGAEPPGNPSSAGPVRPPAAAHG